MPEILENTQTQEYTTSDNGRNVRPALVADSLTENLNIIQLKLWQ